MDTLCGVGLPELVILALLGFVVIGPEHSREVALKLGRFIRKLTTSGSWGEFNQIIAAMRDLPGALVRMAELEETQAELQRTVTEFDRASSQFRFNARGAQTPAAGAAPSNNPWGIEYPVANMAPVIPVKEKPQDRSQPMLETAKDEQQQE
jgi:Sec-independent protein translocase protein TatA